MKIRLGLALSLSLVACDPAPDRGGAATTAKPSATPVTSASALGPAPPAAPVATAPAAPANPLAGTWEGSYDAAKGSVTLPPKVKDKALAADDGKASSGKGTIEIAISAGGDVRGKLTGALGACTLSGRAEEGMVRAKVDPDDPRAPGAMTGVLLGKLEGDAIKADLQVANADATVVRKSAVELKKK